MRVRVCVCGVWFVCGWFWFVLVSFGLVCVCCCVCVLALLLCHVGVVLVCVSFRCPLPFPCLFPFGVGDVGVTCCGCFVVVRGGFVFVLWCFYACVHCSVVFVDLLC